MFYAAFSIINEQDILLLNLYIHLYKTLYKWKKWSVLYFSFSISKVFKVSFVILYVSIDLKLGKDDIFLLCYVNNVWC